MQVEINETATIKKSWQNLKTILKNTFTPVNRQKEARNQLAGLKQTGSVSEYTMKFRRLVSQANDVNEAEQLDKYTKGLKPELQRLSNCSGKRRQEKLWKDSIQKN